MMQVESSAVTGNYFDVAEVMVINRLADIMDSPLTTIDNYSQLMKQPIR